MLLIIFIGLGLETLKSAILHGIKYRILKQYKVLKNNYIAFVTYLNTRIKNKISCLRVALLIKKTTVISIIELLIPNSTQSITYRLMVDFHDY